jgi:hypothetical protein
MQGAHRPHLTTHEVVDLLRSVRLRIRRSRAQNDFGFGRGHDHGGNRRGRNRYYLSTSRINLNVVDGALIIKERKRHQEEGLYFTCHKKGHRVFHARS